MPASVTIRRSLWVVPCLILMICPMLLSCDSSGPEPAADEPASAVISAYPEPKVLADFELQDRTGQSVGKQVLNNQWHLLFFGFQAMVVML